MYIIYVHIMRYIFYVSYSPYIIEEDSCRRTVERLTENEASEEERGGLDVSQNGEDITHDIRGGCFEFQIDPQHQNARCDLQRRVQIKRRPEKACYTLLVLP